MLQIISGRFFKSPDRHVHPAKAILYSNFNWLAPIRTCIGTLDPVDYTGAVASYVFSYTNQIERRGEGFQIVRVGDAEIVRQFRLLCSFGLRAYFAHDRSDILVNCRDRRVDYTDPFLPSSFAPRIFDARIQGTRKDSIDFSALVAQVISMPRSRYSAIMTVLDNLDHAMQVLNWNIDLSYSMLVYCLESLCQTFDTYIPRWDDYDESVKRNLDTTLSSLEQATANSIRETLLSGSHQKLSARFLDFVEAHLSPSYFGDEASSMQNPMTKSVLRRALKNAYALRSGYVHKLQPIRAQLHDARLALGDLFVWDREPYPTFSGLLRVVFHVLNQFILRQSHDPTEDVDWYRELPGTMTLYAAPEYWIWTHDHLNPQSTRSIVSETVRARLSGLLVHIVRIVPDGEALTDLRELLSKYIALEHLGTNVDKLRMRVTSFLYNSLVEPNYKLKDWEKTVFKKDKIVEACTIETIIAALLVYEHIDEPAATCVAVYDKFYKERFSKNAIEVPRVLEVKLLCELVNMCRRSGDLQEAGRISEVLFYEAAGMPHVQSAVVAAMSDNSEIDHSKVFTLRRSPQVASSEPSQAQDGGQVVAIEQSTPVAAEQASTPLHEAAQSTGVELSTVDKGGRGEVW